MDSEELKKVTLNLFAEDVKFFEHRFGYGWSVELRRIMRREVRNYKERDEREELDLKRIFGGS